MTEPTDTNAEIAALILAQTYEERVDLAAHLSGAVDDWLTGGGLPSEIDTPYFAELLRSWAEERQPEEPENG